MNINLSLVLSVISLLFGGGLFFTVYNSLKNIVGKVESIAYGTKCSLKDTLLKTYREYEFLGYMPYDEKHVWLDCYDAYHNLGGNDIMTKYRGKVLEFPETLDELTKQEA